MAKFKWYPNGALRAILGDIDLNGSTIKMGLLNGHTVDLTDDQWTDVSADEVSGTGYTAGGETITPTTSVVQDNAATAWAATTTYAVGDVVRPSTANGHVYKCIVAGDSGGSEPTWPTTAELQVTDGTVTWREAGEAYVLFDSAQVQWTITEASPGITADTAIIYDSTTGYLIGYAVFDSSETASDGGTLTVTPHDDGWLRQLIGF